MPTAQEIKSELEKNGYFVTEKAINQFVEEVGPKLDAIKQNILDTDLKDIGDKSLPKDVSKTKENQSVRLPIVLQIVSIRNISLPESKQWSSTYFDEASSRRTLVLHLTDGHTVCRALEVSALSQLSTNTPPGSKILISGSALKTNHGFVILDSDIKVELLGGTVPELIQTWKAKHLAATRKLLGTKNNSDGEGPPVFKPFEIAQPKPPKESQPRNVSKTETPNNATTNNNNNNNTTQRNLNPRDKKPQSQKQQSRQKQQNQSSNSTTEVADPKPQPNNRAPKQKVTQPGQSNEPKYREVNKATEKPSEPTEQPVKDATTQKGPKAPTQQYYAPKQRTEKQNSNSDRRKGSDRETKFVPKQRHSAQVYQQKQEAPVYQTPPLSYLPPITQFPVTFSATFRILQIFLANSGERFFLQFSLQDASNQIFPAVVDNPELLENVLSLSIVDLKKNCATAEGQVFVQQHTEKAFQSLLNQVATFAFAVLYPGIPFSILSIQ
mmetsp:Transcript_14774/g.20592  ORF Transcript_14774/g.20592 Transcript_14774/m.20592 type:complete len:496 (-) Transcript_14774:1923-3410(-)